MRKFCRGNRGLTLVEILISMALLGLIAIVFLQLFLMSAQIIKKTENKLEATYNGKDTMELMYQLSLDTAYEELEAELLSRGYSKDNHLFLYETVDHKCIELSISKADGDLVKIIAKVYSDSLRTTVESKYEAYYLWYSNGGADEG